MCLFFSFGVELPSKEDSTPSPDHVLIGAVGFTGEAREALAVDVAAQWTEGGHHDVDP